MSKMFLFAGFHNPGAPVRVRNYSTGRPGSTRLGMSIGESTRTVPVDFEYDFEAIIQLAVQIVNYYVVLNAKFVKVSQISTE